MTVTCLIFDPLDGICEKLLLSTQDESVRSIIGEGDVSLGDIPLDSSADAAPPREQRHAPAGADAPAGKEPAHPPKARSPGGGEMSADLNSAGADPKISAQPPRAERRLSNRQKQVIARAAQPPHLRDIRTFLELCVQNPGHVAAFDEYSYQQHALTKLGAENSAVFVWGGAQRASLDKLRQSCDHPLHHRTKLERKATPKASAPHLDDIRTFIDLCVHHTNHVTVHEEYRDQQYALTRSGAE